MLLQCNNILLILQIFVEQSFTGGSSYASLTILVSCNKNRQDNSFVFLLRIEFKKALVIRLGGGSSVEVCPGSIRYSAGFLSSDAD